MEGRGVKGGDKGLEGREDRTEGGEGEVEGRRTLLHLLCQPMEPEEGDEEGGDEARREEREAGTLHRPPWHSTPHQEHLHLPPPPLPPLSSLCLP